MSIGAICPRALWDLKRELLVPITIDVQVRGLRVRDTLVWDMGQRQIAPQVFAKRLTEELGLSPDFVQPIALSVSQQLIDFDKNSPPQWADGTMAALTESVRSIEIDVRFRSVIYRDRLWWDVSCLSNSPELFARCTVADLALPQEMEHAIAFTIHQQLIEHRMELTSRAGSAVTAEGSRNVGSEYFGPLLSHVQPVDQYEFNARDWRNHRDAWQQATFKRFEEVLQASNTGDIQPDFSSSFVKGIGIRVGGGSQQSQRASNGHGLGMRGLAAFASRERGICFAMAEGGGHLPATVQSTEAPGTGRTSPETSPVVASMLSWMDSQGVDAFIVPSDDPHLSEYSAACFNRRAFVSGFTGSAGTAVFLKDEALLWTDGRYHLQAEQQLGAGWTLMKAGKSSVPTIKAFLAKRLTASSRVGIDPFVHSAAFVKDLEEGLSCTGIALAPLDHSGDANPVDTIWGDERPTPPQGAVRLHPLRFAGQTVKDKLAKVREHMSAEGADVLICCMLDEVAYLFNIRGDDIAHCPVVMAYALVTSDGGATLFVSQSKVSAEVSAELQASGIEVRVYEEALTTVRQLAEQGKRVWVDPDRVNYAFFNAVPRDRIISKPSPINAAKGVKNQAELEGMRAAHVRDGAAMVLALSQLERDIADGQRISEVDVDVRITASRAKQEKFIDLSFPTIAGEGRNGAIIHYSAEANTCNLVGQSSMLLLDSGAQYDDGTTDVTRTMHFGEPTLEQKEAYTRVLQGHIGLTTVTFPDGTPGFLIDAFARRSLWEAGLDYQHGTGHGVGAALNVHEGPHSISSRTANTTPLQPGMVVSNEPGYYKGGEGGFGVRIENLLEIVDAGITNEALGRSFYRFEPLTLIPIQKKLLDMALLSAKEIEWLNTYHERVWQNVSPLLEDEAALAWLREASSPISPRE